MKILSISDIHGRNVWKEARFEGYDRIIFLGDYVDGYVVDDETIHANLVDIIQLKRNESEKFILLLGNHDAQYLHYPDYRCSGYRPHAQPVLSELFDRYRAFFQIAFQQGNHLFTHAGITNQWMAQLLRRMGYETLALPADYDVATLLNDLQYQPKPLRDRLFDVGPKRGGDAPAGGPVWADRTETQVDTLTGFHQIVGHTPVNDFTTTGDQRSSITYTDVLKTKTAFYDLEIPD